MRNAILALCATILIVGVNPNLAPQPAISGKPTHIEGIVVDDSTGMPLAGAVVTITCKDMIRGGCPKATATNDGRFSLDFPLLPLCADGVPTTSCEPGLPRVFASRSGYISASPDGSTGSPLVITPGESRNNVVVHVYPAGSIVGKVFDPKGQPLANASLIPFRYRYNNAGTPFRVNFTESKTNDLGEFRMTQMNPGDYFFEIRPEPFPTGDVSSFPGPSYYPGVIDPERAAAIHIAGGVETRMENLTVRLVRGAKLRLHIANETGESPLGGTSASLTRREDGGNPLLSVRSAMAAKETFDGFMEFKGIPPGRYDVVADFVSESIPHRQMRGYASFVVNESDINLEIPVRKRAETVLHGKAITEGSADRTSSPVAGVRLGLMDVAEWIATEVVRPPNEWSSRIDGTFPDRRGTIGLADGPIVSLVKVLETPPGMAVLSITSGEHDILKEGLRQNDGQEQTVIVVLTENAGKLLGTAADANNQKIANAIVALIPDEAERSKWVASSSTDSQGQFQIEVAPGAYHLFAWRKLNGGAYYNSEFMARFAGKGTPVIIAPKGQNTLRIEVLD